MQGDLTYILKNQPKIHTKFIFHQILKGVVLLHSNQIMHRDIKPHNILFKQNIIKIADLGLSRQYN